MRVEYEKQEEDHLAYPTDFLVKHRRLPTLEEDKFNNGPEMFIPTLQCSQKRRRDSKDDGEDDSEDVSEDDGEDDSEDDSEGDSEGDSEDDSKDDTKLDDSAIEDNELDTDYMDC